MRLAWIELSLLLSPIVVFGSPGDEPDAVVVKPAFEQLTVTLEPFGMSPQAIEEELLFKSDGKCWYKAKPQPGLRSGGVFEHTLSQARLQTLNQWLEKTSWLAEAKAAGGPQLHQGVVTVTLVRNKQETRIVSQGVPQGNYAGLIHEFRSIAAQERRIYLHDYVGGRDATETWSELGRELASLRGEPYAKSQFDIEYTRYLPIARRIVRSFHDQSEEELIPAIRLIAFLRAQSEIPFLHRMSDDRSARIRQEVARALSQIHDKESLPVLVRMMLAGSTRRDVGFELIRWGDDAVPEIVKLIEQVSSGPARGNEFTIGEDMVRAYLDHWDQIKKPMPMPVIAAIQKVLSSRDPADGTFRTTYFADLLNRAQP